MLTSAAGTVHRLEAVYGTERPDTAYTETGEVICGDTDNGFGLLFNWNRLGDGTHTVTSLGEEFAQGLDGECTVEDFPASGETVTLEWQQPQQNFVIVERE